MGKAHSLYFFKCLLIKWALQGELQHMGAIVHYIGHCGILPAALFILSDEQSDKIVEDEIIDSFILASPVVDERSQDFTH